MAASDTYAERTPSGTSVCPLCLICTLCGIGSVRLNCQCNTRLLYAPPTFLVCLASCVLPPCIRAVQMDYGRNCVDRIDTHMPTPMVAVSMAAVGSTCAPSAVEYPTTNIVGNPYRLRITSIPNGS